MVRNRPDLFAKSHSINAMEGIWNMSLLCLTCLHHMCNMNCEFHIFDIEPNVSMRFSCQWMNKTIWDRKLFIQMVAKVFETVAANYQPHRHTPCQKWQSAVQTPGLRYYDW